MEMCVLLCFIDPRVKKIRNKASSCPGIFSRTVCLERAASGGAIAPEPAARHRGVRPEFPRILAAFSPVFPRFFWDRMSTTKNLRSDIVVISKKLVGDFWSQKKRGKRGAQTRKTRKNLVQSLKNGEHLSDLKKIGEKVTKIGSKMNSYGTKLEWFPWRCNILASSPVSSMRCFLFSLCPPAPMNHAKIFKGRPPRDVPSKLVQLWHKTFPCDQCGQFEMKKPTRLSNKTSTAWSCAEDQILENKNLRSMILYICTER